MSVDLKLGSINFGNDTWSIAATSLGESSVVGASVSVAADHAKSQPLGNYGTLKLDAEGVLTLQGGSALTGDVVIGGKGASVLSAVAFGAPVSVAFEQSSSTFTKLQAIKGSTGADSISVENFISEDFVLDAGAGNDTVVINKITKGKVDAGAGADLVSVAGGNNGNVVLGAGKDTVVFGDNNATVNLADYSFADDVIVLEGASLTAQGKLENGGKAVTGFAATNNLYTVRLGQAGSTLTTVLATAAEDSAKVAIDASGIKDKDVIINAMAADAANITTGTATLTAVSLNSNKEAGVDTVKIGNTSASVSVNVVNFNTDDVLSFAGLTFDKTTIGATSDNVTLTNGKVSVNLGNQATVKAAASGDDPVAKFNLNGMTIYASTTDNQYIDLTEETDLSKINVKGQLGDTAKTGIVTTAKVVDLGAVNINNVDMVSLTADAVAGTSLIGTNNKYHGVTLDASVAKEAVAIWAKNTVSSAEDIINLNGSNEVADTLWFGTTDGHDSVTGFQLASDVLYLHDANAMTAAAGTITVGKASLNVVVSGATTEEIMQVQTAQVADKTFYVAGDFTADSNGIYLAENAGKVDYYAIGKDASVSVNDSTENAVNYTFLKTLENNYAGAAKANIVAGGSVASINAANINNTDSKIIIEGVANVTLGAGTNEVWVNGAAKEGTVVLGGGTDKVWFSASDKNVSVTGFDTESDVIALTGTVTEFTAKKDGTAAVISNANKGKLTLDKANGINIVDGTLAKFKLYTDDADYATNTDGTNIYMGTKLNVESSVTDATTIIVDGAVNTWGLNSAAMVSSSVKEINMSGSSADFVLIGSANASNTITGGMGTNYLNGGGASKDVLIGTIDAVDFFYYGKEDGNDTLMTVGVEDEVRMYDIATTDIADIKDGADKTVFTLKNDSKLTIDGSIEGVTFALTDGTFKYDSSVEGKWIKK